MSEVTQLDHPNRVVLIPITADQIEPAMEVFQDRVGRLFQVRIAAHCDMWDVIVPYARQANIDSLIPKEGVDFHVHMAKHLFPEMSDKAPSYQPPESVTTRVEWDRRRNVGKWLSVRICNFLLGGPKDVDDNPLEIPASEFELLEKHAQQYSQALAPLLPNLNEVHMLPIST